MKAKRFTAERSYLGDTEVVLAVDHDAEMKARENVYEVNRLLWKGIAECAERERDRLNDVLDRVMGERSKIRAERDEARAALEKERDAEIRKLTRYDKQATDECERLRGEVSRQRDRAVAAERELQRLEDCIREYEGRACCTKWINNARHRPECQWAAAERERDDADVALRGAAEAHDVLADELGTAKAERDELQERFENLNDICDRHISDNAQMRADRDEARAALAKRSGVAELRGVEAANRVLRAELAQAKAKVLLLAMDQHNCSAESALVYHLVSAPSDEDLEALWKIWDAIQGCNDEHVEDVHAFLEAIADLARAKETTL